MVDFFRQLKNLQKANTTRRKLSDRYNEKLKNIKWISTPILKPWAKSACHNYVIRTKFRDQLNLFLKEKNISSGVHYLPVHHFSYYRKNNLSAFVPVTERVWKTLLTLPLYPDLTYDEQDRVISAIWDFKTKI